METILGKDCLSFAEDVAERCADNRHILLCDRLIRSTGGMAYHCLEAGSVGYGRDKADELYTALKFAKESRILFGLCVKNKVFDEAFSNRGERKIASLCYRISKACDNARGESLRHPYRFPSVRILFSSRRLSVRSWKKTDIPAFTELCRDSEYREFAYYCEEDPEAAYLKIRNMTDLFVISRKGDDGFIGCAAIVRDGEGDRRFKIHVGFNAENRGRGYFSEIIKETADHAANRLGAGIVSVYLPSGRAYLTRSLKRIGFENEGTLKGYGADGGDVTVLSLTFSEQPRDYVG